jgi:hypothetical protein
MRAWACGLYSTLAIRVPDRSRSSVNAGFPFASLTASVFVSAWPTTRVAGTSSLRTTRGAIGERPSRS